MTSIYLTAAHPRWTPRTEADLQSALDGGLIEESHYLDLKEAPASKSGNKEAARDMASFAIDGGALIIGIAEDKTNRTFYLAPQPLKGLAEKMEQIARSIADPPLNVLTQEIGSEADPTTGYLIVHIPASPAAPHMVEGRYHGRGDKTKHVLPDAEVIRLHERRRLTDRDALALLQHEIDRDPIPADLRQQAHLFLVAQPLTGPADMLLRLTSGSNWSSNLTAFVNHAHTLELNTLLDGTDVSPSLLDATDSLRRSRGAARATRNLGQGRIFSPTSDYGQENAVELQVHENGGLRLFFSRLSDTWSDETREKVILDKAVVNYTRRFLALILTAGEHAGYFGNWALALGATGLNGLRAKPSQGAWGQGPQARYDEDTYTTAAEVTWADLNHTPGAITGRLTGPLLRALAIEPRYRHIFND